MSIHRILLRTLAWEFYRQNAGFFIVLLFIALGFIDAATHYHLMMAALHNPMVLAGFMLLWLLYWVKTVHYTWTALQEKQNQFLYQLYLYPSGQQNRLLALVHLEQFSPVILYAGIMVGIGLSNGLYTGSALSILFIGLMLVSSTLLYRFLIRSAGKEMPLPLIPEKLSHNLPKAAWSLPLFYLVHQQKLAFFLSKACTCLFILLVAYLYTKTSYDSRLASMCISLAALGNAVIIYHIHTFNQIDLSLQRNLPISLFKRFLHNSVCMLILALPEILLFSRHFYQAFNAVFLLQAAFLFISILLLLSSYLLHKHLQKEQFMLRLAFFLVLFYLIIIYGTAPWLIASAGLLIAYILFHLYYYRFELTAATTEA